jgi:N-acetylmuramoyl-L-alanine amidase
MNWTHIMVHHSLTEDNNTVSWPAIRRYHIKHNGWIDIGYHFGVEMAGLEYEAVVGRPLTMKGAHCLEGGMNEKAIGICVVGNYDLYAPSSLAIEVLVSRLIAPLMKMFNIPVQNIVFHRDFATYKTCPGEFFTKSLIINRLPGGIV